jgi:DNA-binding response OmpR family regulator
MKIVIFENDRSVLELYRLELSEMGHKIISYHDSQIAPCDVGEADLVIIGTPVPLHKPHALLKKIKRKFPDIPVIVNASLEIFCTEAMLTGADFCCRKSFDLGELRRLINAVDKKNKKKKTNAR